MNKLLRAGFIVALCAGAAACADNKPAPVVEAPPPPPPPPAPVVVTAFDGVYRGQLLRTRGDRAVSERHPACPAPHRATVQVANGVFSLMVTKKQAFSDVQVGPDGSFNAGSGDQMLTGMIADGRLSGTMNLAECRYTVTLIMRAPKAKHT